MKEPKTMSPTYFKRVLKRRLALIEQQLLTKAKEYATGNDRMHNFNTYMVQHNENPSREQAIFNLMLKQWVSLLDMIDDSAILTTKEFTAKWPEALIEEKLGDLINYLILMEASFKQTIDLKHSEEEDVVRPVFTPIGNLENPDLS